MQLSKSNRIISLVVLWLMPGMVFGATHKKKRTAGVHKAAVERKSSSRGATVKGASASKRKAAAAAHRGRIAAFRDGYTASGHVPRTHAARLRAARLWNPWT